MRSTLNLHQRGLAARLYLTIGLGLAAGTTLAQTPLQEVNFGIISTEATQNLRQDWQPVIDTMSRQTGLKVNAFFAPDYAGIIEGMRFGKVHVAWMGNKSAMEAVDRAGGEVFAQMVNADGTQGYYSHLIVHRDSGLTTLDDVFKKGSALSFGNGDPNSTSGFLVPGYYVFAKNKVDPKSTFKVVRSANHETNALAVANRQVDVATNNSENLEKIKARHPDKFNALKIVWTSPLIPLDPLVMRGELPLETKQKIKGFFMAYGKSDPQEKEALMKLSKLSGFKASSNDQLIPIRQLTLFTERNKIAGDSAINDADRAARLARIDEQLSALSTH